MGVDIDSGGTGTPSPWRWGYELRCQVRSPTTPMRDVSCSHSPGQSRPGDVTALRKRTGRGSANDGLCAQWPLAGKLETADQISYSRTPQSLLDGSASWHWRRGGRFKVVPR